MAIRAGVTGEVYEQQFILLPGCSEGRIKLILEVIRGCPQGGCCRAAQNSGAGFRYKRVQVAQPPTEQAWNEAQRKNQEERSQKRTAYGQPLVFLDALHWNQAE